MMKILFWLSLPVLLLATYFTLPQIKNRPETESKPPVTQMKESDTFPAVEPVSLSVSPASLIQGEPALITIEGLDSTSTITSIALDGKPLAVFVDEGKIAAL